MQETKITTRPEHMEQKDASRPCQFLHLEDAEISRQRDDGLVEVRESAVLMYVSKQRLLPLLQAHRPAFCKKDLTAEKRGMFEDADFSPSQSRFLDAQQQREALLREKEILMSQFESLSSRQAVTETSFSQASDTTPETAPDAACHSLDPLLLSWLQELGLLDVVEVCQSETKKYCLH